MPFSSMSLYMWPFPPPAPPLLLTLLGSFLCCILIFYDIVIWYGFFPHPFCYVLLSFFLRHFLELFSFCLLFSLPLNVFPSVSSHVCFSFLSPVYPALSFSLLSYPTLYSLSLELLVFSCWASWTSPSNLSPFTAHVPSFTFLA